MEDIYANTDSEAPSTPQKGPRSSQRRFYGAIVFLGLLSFLLMAGIIRILFYCHDFEAYLTKHLKDRENQLSSLTEQRELLNANLTEMTKELERLQSLFNQNKTCSEGWKGFRCSCYFFSNQAKTWEESRQDCRDRGADLVIVDSIEEQEFLTNNIITYTWIGLSDRDNEGTWKWTDDTPLTQRYWREDQPDNGGGDPRYGEEDCVHFVEADWNDIRCNNSLRWICEK